jgi:hypothetical protein
LRDTPCSARTDAVSRYKMLFGALIATVWLLRLASVVTGEPGSVYMPWVPGSITDPSAKISRSAWPCCYAWI